MSLGFSLEHAPESSESNEILLLCFAYVRRGICSSGMFFHVVRFVPLLLVLSLLVYSHRVVVVVVAVVVAVVRLA